MKKIGFTLAEVIITIGIIGVVAAMTIPTLIHRAQNKILENQTKHFYAMMTQAFRRYMADENTETLTLTPLNWNDDISEEEIQENWDKFIKSYLKVAKECQNERDCFSEKVQVLSGGKIEIESIIYGSKSYALMNGYTLSVLLFPSYSPGSLVVDVNGKKGPNISGRDIWFMSIYRDGSLDESSLTPECKKSSEACIYGGSVAGVIARRFETCNGSIWAYGAGCFGRFKANNFKFDY